MEHATVLSDRSALIDATEPAEFNCTRCGAIELRLDRQLPPGWEKHEVAGRTIVHCDDCVAALEAKLSSGAGAEPRQSPAIVALEGAAETPLVIDETGWATIQHPARGSAMSYFLYAGLRIGHWPMPEQGTVALQIHGGTAPGAALVDDAVLVLLKRRDLRDLIEHLQAIEATIAPETCDGA